MVAPATPTSPTMVSIAVHVFRFVFSSISNNDLESQNPESFTWLNAVPPAAIAIVIVASCNCENPQTIGMEEIIPAAKVIDTVAEPTEILTTAATKNATNTIGNGRLPTRFPNNSPIPEF